MNLIMMSHLQIFQTNSDYNAVKYDYENNPKPNVSFIEEGKKCKYNKLYKPVIHAKYNVKQTSKNIFSCNPYFIKSLKIDGQKMVSIQPAVQSKRIEIYKDKITMTNGEISNFPSTYGQSYCCRWIVQPMDNNIKIGDCSNEIMLLGQTGNTKFGWSLSLPLKEINTFIDESANTLIVENAGFTFDQGTKGGVCLLIFNENTNKYDLIDTICVCEYLKTAITSLPRFESTGEHEVEIELLDNAPLVYMFANTDVQNITQLKDITSIGNGAFNYCSALTEITIPNSVTSIGYQAFENCDSLASITIPEGVTEIGERAFYYCDKLASVDLGNGIIKIGDNAFEYCSSLTEITIPDSVTSIGKDVFYECTSLTSVDLGNGVTSIGDLAFYNCRSLTSIAIPDGVTEIGYQAFSHCSALTEITIPDNVTSIGESAFLYCSSLTEIIIPDGVTKIAGRTFNGCESLTSVTIPNSVTEIGEYAIYHCTSLTSITIPDSVTEIDRYAFGNCTSLASVYCKAITPPTGGSYMFDSNASNRKIYVPMASVDAYKSAAGWSDYAGRIEGYNF